MGARVFCEEESKIKKMLSTFVVGITLTGCGGNDLAFHAVTVLDPIDIAKSMAGEPAFRPSNYEGDWTGSKRQGHGVNTYPDGSKYVGQWKDNKRHGRGGMFYLDGSKHVGNWIEGKMHGQGTFTFPDGRKYVGEWRNDKKYGQGTLINVDGTKHIGQWKGEKFVKDNE
ncbi:hypothetical protein N9J12_08590 [Alphaproteobacteria bacterium]|nr:hypothetical protein [Alphaproteobacteria bacterium]